MQSSKPVISGGIGGRPSLAPVTSENDVKSSMMDEIPAVIAERMSAMISQMKMQGQIPADANEMELMRTLHQDMLKERQHYLLSQQMLHQPAQTPQEAHLQQLSTPAAYQPATLTATDEQVVNPESLITMIRDFITLCTDNHTGHSCSASDNHQDNPFLRDFLKSAMESIRSDPRLVHETDGETGDSVLHLATSNNLDMLVRVLLANGANVNHVNNCHQSAIHFAAKAGQIMLIEMFLQAGGDITLRDEKGWTALHHAAAGTGLYCPHTVHYLTSCCGLSFTEVTNDGWSILHVISSIKKENNINLVDIILSQTEVDVLSVDVNGNTALHLATETAQPYLCYQIVNSVGAKALLITNKAGKNTLDVSRTAHSMDGFLLGKEMEKWLDQGPNHRPKETTPYEYKKHMYAPTGVFLLFCLLSGIFTPQRQGWLCSAGFILLQALVFLPRHRINHPSRLPNPCRFAGVAGALLFTAYISIFHLIPSTYQTRTITCLLLSTSMLATAYLYIKLLILDPGFTKESKRKDSGEFYTMRDLVSVYRKPGIWCSACRLIPTKPSKHCKLCNRCVYWMDHHCLYTNTCIGFNTYHIFVWYTISLVTTQLCYISLLDSYIRYYYPSSSAFNMLVSLFMMEGFVFVISVGVVCFCAFTIPLLFRSFYNISYGYTTFFQPRGTVARSEGEPRLTLKDKLLNITTFLSTGRMRTRDPAFKI